MRKTKKKNRVFSILLASVLTISNFLPITNVRAEEQMNYAEDEAKIENYSETERYRTTDLQPGSRSQDLLSSDVNDEKDGFSFELKNPSSTSPSKTEYGFQININKERGQRTYARFYFTDSGLIPVDIGEKPTMNEGDQLTNESPIVNYKPVENLIVDQGGRQKNLNYGASEDTLKFINNKDNSSIHFGIKDNYTQDNPRVKFFGGSFALGYIVNPWPNENDKLELIKMNGSHNKKEFVQGQTIVTDITVENADDSARERLVGQVYHPVTGEIVPGAKAYVNEQNKVVIEMPKGAVDENGNINKDSIFYNNPNYRGLQNLSVKLFARPRTAEEFRTLAETPDEYGDVGVYTETGAGSSKISHKGKPVTIDNQGIDRYDHYNLIGEFKLNLDDTRYYDQDFIDDNNEDTSKHVSSKVKPGVPFEVELYVPDTKNNKNDFPHQKTPEDMETARDNQQVIGEVNTEFLDKENKGKAEKDQWKLDYDKKTLPTKFTITPPESARAGDFIAIPLKYTYTNGSTDTHWFHFVVQDSTNDIPEYSVKVDFPANEQKSLPEVSGDERKLQPKEYYISEGTEFKDDKGNEWTVSINKDNGEVTAQPIDPSNFNGGETLTVPVKVKYEDPDEPDKLIEEQTKAEFVIKERVNMTPRYNAKAGKAGDKLSSSIILNEEDKYNRRPTKFSLKSDKFIDDKGNEWAVEINENTGEVTATVPTPEGEQTIDGALLNVPVVAHYYEVGSDKEIGTRDIEVQFVASGTDNTYEKTVEIPFETKVIKNPELKKGEIEVVKEGEKGSKTITYVIKDSVVDKEQTREVVTKEAQPRIIHVGEGVNDGTHTITETREVAFETKIEFDDSLAPGEQQVVQEGEAGEEQRTITLTIEDGKVTEEATPKFKQTKAPKERIIKVGRNTEGEVTHTEKLPFKYEINYDKNLKSGEYVIDVDGKEGTKVTSWTIKNSEIVDGPNSKVTEEPVNAIIRVGQKDFTGELKTKKINTIMFETEYVVDETLEPGTTVVEQEGELGIEETEVTHKIVNGEATETVDGETVQTKAPVKRIVKVGAAKSNGTYEYTNKVPFEVKVVYNDKLNKGEHKVAQKGVEGEEKFTAKIVDSKVVETSKPELIKEPQPEIIEVGNKDFTGKVEHIEKFDIPFEVEVRYNDEIPAGQYNVLQEGEKGSYEVLYSQEIKNGEPQGELSKTEQNRVEPKNHIIEIGNKPFETEIVDKVKREIHFTTDIIYDENLEAGAQIVEEDGELGEEEVTITNKVVNGEVIKTEDSKVIKKPKNRVIRIGIKPTTKTVEIPYETEYKHNPELKAGETNILQEGKAGKVEHVITFNRVTGKIEVTEHKVDSVKKIVEYGSKTEGEFKFKNDIPFEVEIIKDSDMEVGQEEVVQEGELGEEETTVIIENSKEVSRDTELIKEPVKRIVKIGTKCKACEPQKPCEPEKPEQPDEPTEPIEPEQPTEPSEPEIPGVTDPVEPTTPSDKTPEQPEEPSKPSGEKPGEPTKPSKPSETTEPSKERPSEPQGTTQKVKPSDTKVTAKAEKSLKPVVDTGVGAFGLASGLSLVTAAVVAGIAKKRKEDE